MKYGPKMKFPLRGCPIIPPILLKIPFIKRKKVRVGSQGANEFSYDESSSLGMVTGRFFGKSVRYGPLCIILIITKQKKERDNIYLFQ